MSLYNSNDQVSKRELEVLELLSHGYSTPQIAQQLFISTNTIKVHRKSLFKKFAAINVAHLVRSAFEAGVFQSRHAMGMVMVILFIVPGIQLQAQNLEVDGKVIIHEMDTLSMHPANVIRMDDGHLAIKQVQVGDAAYGGIVFYVDPSGEHGLVADTTDLGFGVAWEDTTIDLGIIQDGIYNGQQHTTIILATHRTANTAARLCYESTNNGYSDWFLPSFDELDLMNTELHLNGLGNFIDEAFYWSSTEFALSPYWAKAVKFGSLGAHAFSKTNSFEKVVRAVRRF